MGDLRNTKTPGSPLWLLRAARRVAGRSGGIERNGNNAGDRAVAFYVYILASQRNGTLYVGHTDSISRRVWEHREGVRAGFTARYGVKRLVHYEAFEGREGAFARERAMKKWRRIWKIELIERLNTGWRDLFEELPLE